MRNTSDLPISDKYCLTIPEASEYFGIGETKMRKLASDHIESGFFIQNGVKILVKRKRFEDFLEDFLDQLSAI